MIETGIAENKSNMNGSQMMTSLDYSNNNPMSPKSKIPQLRPKPIEICQVRDTPPKGILTPKESLSLSRASSREDMHGWSSASVHAERWKNKYLEADKKCKGMMAKNEKTLREHNELERHYQIALERNQSLANQLIEKDAKLNKLRAVSEKVYKEYDQLKNQYNVETQAMHKAMQSAGQWYQQNRKLKRKSAALMQRLSPQVIQDWDSLDATDAASESSGGEELEGLRETVAELSREIARLQTEISSLKLQEFETTELNVNLMQELEQEKLQNKEVEERLKIANEEVERSKRITQYLVIETKMHRDQLEQYKNQATQMRGEAESAKKERDVLAHRTSIYLEALPEAKEPGYESRECEILLKELENLRATMEEERLLHAKELEEVQDKLMDKENSDEMFLLQEQLNLAEDDLRKALERAEKAESLLRENENKRKSIMTRVALFESPKESMTDPIIREVAISNPPPVNAPPPPPLPPLPPPPPPPPMPAANIGDGKPTSTAIADMAAILGLKEKPTEKKKASKGAIDDIINQIKGGRFHLKTTEPKTVEKKQKDEPAALKELRNILGTLKRRPKSMKESNKENSDEKSS